MPTPPDLRIALLRRSHAVATFGPMTAVCWGGRLDPASLEETFEVCREQSRRHPEGGGFALMVRRHTARPDGDARKLVTAALAEMRDSIRSAAVIIESTGFAASIARSVVSFVFLASNKDFPMRVFSELESAAIWQCTGGHAAVGVEPGPYAVALRELRAEHDAVRD